MKVSFLFKIFFCLLIIPGLHAQKITIDLAANVKNKSFPVKKNEAFDITIENMLPIKAGGSKYSIVLEKKYHIPEPLEADEYSITNDAASAVGICGELETLYTAIENAKAETVVRSKKKELEKKLKEVEPGTCALQVINAKSIIDATKMVLTNNVISQGEYLELIISRDGTNGEKVSWLFTFDAGKKGQWVNSYGFSFATHLFSNEGAFYLAQQGNEFVITEEEDRKDLDFIPSIMFSYLFNNNKDFKWSPTGGLGIDSNKPTVFLGVSLFYQYNLSFTFGLVAHPQKQLAGRYKAGDILMELIEPEQLHQEPYKINPFFGLSFRFGKNPFQPEVE